MRPAVKGRPFDDATMEEPSPRKPGSLFKRALLNQYNYILVGSTALFALASGSWLPAVVGAGAEVLWLVLGPDTSLFRRWAERQESREAREQLRLDAARMMNHLEESYRDRYLALERSGQEIQALALENRGLETRLLQSEMAKLGQLLHSFLKMCASHQRLTRYLADNPISDVERDIARCQRALKQEEDARVQASLKQALSLAQKRLKQHTQIEGAWKALSVQMDTLEKSFDYLKSHILGIGTQEELAEELDNLVMGVSSVAEIEASTSELMSELRATAVTRAGTVRS
jgi:hypothetical protein